MPKLFIMRGLPGSGKSTLAKALEIECEKKGVYKTVILSTDDYWVRPDGEYDFNARLLEQAHEWTFRQFARIVSEFEGNYSAVGNVILDNTNVRLVDFKRYTDLAIENSWEVELHEPITPWKFDVEELSKRNQHSVPLKTIERMLSRWEKSEDINKLLLQESV